MPSSANGKAFTRRRYRNFTVADVLIIRAIGDETTDEWLLARKAGQTHPSDPEVTCSPTRGPLNFRTLGRGWYLSMQRPISKVGKLVPVAFPCLFLSPMGPDHQLAQDP